MFYSSAQKMRPLPSRYGISAFAQPVIDRPEFLRIRQQTTFAASRFSVYILIILCLLGCEGGVREDRTIEFSRDGTQVAFQHGREGGFVASADGQGLTKIFQPDESVLATSRPLASPTDGRLIFTTAEPLEGHPAPAGGATLGPTPAEGRIVFAGAVRYVCWLSTEPKPDQPAVVKKLFEATCGHLGYVSAGLAVRWHPDGKHILYSAAVDKDVKQHTLFEFDLTSETSRRVFPHSATAIIFDFTPAGTRLVCVASNLSHTARSQKSPSKSLVDAVTGTWIGQPADEKSWWRVPGSEALTDGELRSEIERLRASRPAWTRDDSQFAFVSQMEPNDAAKAASHLLQRVELAGRKSTIITASDKPLTDLHWSPDGKTLGYLQRDTAGAGTLNFVDLQGQISKRPGGDPVGAAAQNGVRRFAGFDASGEHIAYIVAESAEPRPVAKRWALLLIASPLRDSVRIAGLEAQDAGREIFSGMQVTFPLWSPTEEKLSLWLTFTPRYLSLLSVFAQMGLRPGDPVATIDIKTGAISWMAVSPQEELQIGHYHLLKRQEAEAWRWYTKAREKLPAHKPPANWEAFVRGMGAPENCHVFEYVCLKRMGRDAEAAAKWIEFEQNFYPLPPEPLKAGEPAPPVDLVAAMFGQRTDLLKPIIRDLFVAEVFLSVDGLHEGIAHFQKSPPAENDAAAFSRAVLLAQLMLIAGKHEDYLEHCTRVVVPLALKLWQNDKPGQSANERNQAIPLIGELCLAPMFRADFMTQLPPEVVQRQMLAWKELATKHDAGLPAVAIDLAMRAAALALNDPNEAKQAENRITANTAAQQVFSGRPIDEVIASWFEIAQR
jgi:hypothetical protein